MDGLCPAVLAIATHAACQMQLQGGFGHAEGAAYLGQPAGRRLRGQKSSAKHPIHVAIGKDMNRFGNPVLMHFEAPQGLGDDAWIARVGNQNSPVHGYSLGICA